VLTSRMGLAQTSPPDERAKNLREPLRSLRLCVILSTQLVPPHRPPPTTAAASAGASTCNICCNYPIFPDLLIMEHLCGT
jgi:hypothetical protein